MPSTLDGTDVFDSSLPKGVVGLASTHLDTGFSQVVSSLVKVDITGLNATITPKSANSVILIFAQWCGEPSAAGAYNAMFGLRRNGIDIGVPKDSGGRISGFAPPKISYHTDDSSTMESCAFRHLDMPQSIEPQTYSMTYVCTNNYTLYTGRTKTDSDVNYCERGTAGILLLEILP